MYFMIFKKFLSQQKTAFDRKILFDKMQVA